MTHDNNMYGYLNININRLLFCNVPTLVTRQHKSEDTVAAFFSFSQLIYPLPCSFLHNTGFSQADKTYHQTPLQLFGWTASLCMQKTTHVGMQRNLSSAQEG